MSSILSRGEGAKFGLKGGGQKILHALHARVKMILFPLTEILYPSLIAAYSWRWRGYKILKILEKKHNFCKTPCKSILFLDGWIRNWLMIQVSFAILGHLAATFSNLIMITCTSFLDIQTYRHTDIQTYRHTDIQTYRHTDIQTYRHTDIQT